LIQKYLFHQEILLHLDPDDPAAPASQMIHLDPEDPLAT
jgi:hypothetical protein